LGAVQGRKGWGSQSVKTGSGAPEQIDRIKIQRAGDDVELEQLDASLTLLAGVACWRRYGTEPCQCAAPERAELDRP